MSVVRLTDRQMEKKSFRRQQQKHTHGQELPLKILNSHLNSLINRVQYRLDHGKEGNQAVMAGGGFGQRIEEEHKRREMMCVILMIISWSIMVNEYKELLLQPAITANDAFSSVSAHSLEQTLRCTHMFLFEAS